LKNGVYWECVRDRESVSMKKNYGIVAILAITVLLLASCHGKSAGSNGVSTESIRGGTADGNAAAPFASIVYFEGSVTQDGKALAIGDGIRDGALIETDRDGLAEIVFDGKNALSIGPSASLRVRLSDLEKSVNVERGKVTAVLRKLNKLSGGKLDVRTPSLVAGVRGTSFCVWVSGTAAETYFCTCNGRIEFIPGGTSESVIAEASHHEALLFTGTGETVSFVPAPADMDPRHVDADLENLAARIGETMDWSVVEE